MELQDDAMLSGKSAVFICTPKVYKVCSINTGTNFLLLMGRDEERS